MLLTLRCFYGVLKSLPLDLRLMELTTLNVVFMEHPPCFDIQLLLSIVVADLPGFAEEIKGKTVINY